MATRGHYIFNEKTIIYNHWDNYPEGACILLNRMLLQDNQRRADWAAKFIKANPSAEITNGEFYGGAEYNYYIDTKAEKIRVMSVYWDDESGTEKEKVFFEGSIYDFINEYYPKSAEVINEDYEYRKDKRIKLNTWKNGESLELLKRELKNEIETFTEYATFSADNPNKNDKKIQEILEKMKMFFN